MIWFTSDTHFGHENMLRLADRPWSTVAQMNDDMVASVNSKVAMDDELYILGDFSFKMTIQEAYELRKSIACKRVHLLPGNHDKDWTQPAVADAFIVEPPICVLKIDRQKIVLSHYPWPTGRVCRTAAGIFTGISTAAAARTTGSTSGRGFCAMTWAWTPTATPR